MVRRSPWLRLLLTLLLIQQAPVRGDQILRQARIRAPRMQPEPEQPLPESPARTVVQPWDRRTEPLALHKEKKGFHPVGVQHDREWPTFYNDPVARIWNAPPGFGAGLPLASRDQAVRPETGSRTSQLLGQGGLKGRIRAAIAKDRAQRYQDKIEGMKLLEQYRAEKALLGLCPIDDCEEPRFILEGRNFSPEGFCRTHAEEHYGKRVGWSLEAVEGRRRRREARRQDFLARWHSGGRFQKQSGRPDEVGATPGVARSSIGQAPLPQDFPRPGDLGPVGSLPLFADPRDPAGFPYDRIDPTPDPVVRPGEATSWVHLSRSAP